VQGLSNPEVGPAKKIVAVPGTPGAVVALFPDGNAYYSPDGFNLGGGGATILAYKGDLQIINIVPVGSGVDTLFADGTVFFSTDGRNLGGGGGTVLANGGALKVTALVKVGTGVDAILSSASGPYFSTTPNRAQVYYSPDGRNLGGGGHSVLVYAGSESIAQIVAMGPGDEVVTLLSNQEAYYSPNNRNLGGGGSTMHASAEPILQLVKVGGGVLAEFAGSVVRLSPDGTKLDAGVAVPAWVQLPEGPFAPRDSVHGAAFAGRLWFSGGFADPANADSCFTTCSFFDLWSSRDATGTSWNSAPAFATATTPNPRDTDAIVHNGVPDVPPPADFYDAYAALIVWNVQLTAIGATVWRSADGVTWLRNNQADGSAVPGPLPVRATENTRAVILNGALFVLQPDSGEVYRSIDPNAAVWTDLGVVPGFAPRCGAAVFTAQGKIWIEGGGACDYSHVYHDMWSSADGVNWTLSPAPAAWPARMWPCIATGPDGITWLATGYAPTDWTNTSGVPVVRYGANHSDLWYSRNGSDWRQFKARLGSGLPDDGLLEPRHAPTCYVTGDPAAGMKLLIVAGSGGRDQNGFNARVLNSVRSLPVPAADALP
jgi:hypothetical protein